MIRYDIQIHYDLIYNGISKEAIYSTEKGTKEREIVLGLCSEKNRFLITGETDENSYVSGMLTKKEVMSNANQQHEGDKSMERNIEWSMTENTYSQLCWGMDFNDWQNNMGEKVFERYREKYPKWFWTDRMKVKEKDCEKKIILKPVLTDATEFSNHVSQSPNSMNFINYLFYFDEINNEWYDIFRIKLTKDYQIKMNEQNGDFRYSLMSDEKENKSLIREVFSYMSWLLYRSEVCEDGPLFRKFYQEIGCNMFTDLRIMKLFGTIQYRLLYSHSEKKWMFYIISIC